VLTVVVASMLKLADKTMITMAIIIRSAQVDRRPSLGNLVTGTRHDHLTRTWRLSGKRMDGKLASYSPWNTCPDSIMLPYGYS
jgi:hypothetical protein